MQFLKNSKPKLVKIFKTPSGKPQAWADMGAQTISDQANTQRTYVVLKTDTKYLERKNNH